MPRPPLKRHRPKHFAKDKRVSIPDQSQARQLLERKVANKPMGKRPQDSDDSDELVTTRTSGRSRKRQDLYASGAVGRGDKPGSYPTRAQTKRNLREDTEEILSQRSRSTSRTNTPGPSSDKESNGPTATKDKTPKASAASAGRRAREPSVLVNGTASNSQPEVSVLGNIKPRKRQASILRLIEDDPNQSSIVNSDDEDQFLPDAISTPVTATKNVASSLVTSAPTSLKRKRRSVERQPLLEATSGIRDDPDRVTETPRKPSPPRLAPPSRIQHQKLQRAKAGAQNTKDVMALPESSDDEDDVEVSEDRPRKLGKTQATMVPSTSQLQSLMPSKNHVRVRQGQAQHEYDIPEDSAQVSEEDENDHSTFVPSKPRKTQKRPNAAVRPGSRRDQTTNKPRNQAKSTNVPSHTPSSVRIRTPLPLSSKKNRITQAKSPSKQGTAMLDKSANTPSRTKPVKGAKKQYGGSRRVAAGKENAPITLSGDLSTDSDTADKRTERKANDTPLAADAKAWNRKWADIDDFSLDFEDVSASIHSSSSNTR